MYLSPRLHTPQCLYSLPFIGLPRAQTNDLKWNKAHIFVSSQLVRQSFSPPHACLEIGLSWSFSTICFNLRYLSKLVLLNFPVLSYYSSSKPYKITLPNTRVLISFCVQRYSKIDCITSSLEFWVAFIGKHTPYFF